VTVAASVSATEESDYEEEPEPSDARRTSSWKDNILQHLAYYVRAGTKLKKNKKMELMRSMALRQGKGARFSRGKSLFDSLTEMSALSKTISKRSFFKGGRKLEDISQTTLANLRDFTYRLWLRQRKDLPTTEDLEDEIWDWRWWKSKFGGRRNRREEWWRSPDKMNVTRTPDQAWTETETIAREKHFRTIEQLIIRQRKLRKGKDPDKAKKGAEESESDSSDDSSIDWEEEFIALQQHLHRRSTQIYLPNGKAISLQRKGGPTVVSATDMAAKLSEEDDLWQRLVNKQLMTETELQAVEEKGMSFTKLQRVIEDLATTGVMKEEVRDLLDKDLAMGRGLRQEKVQQLLETLVSTGIVQLDQPMTSQDWETVTEQGFSPATTRQILKGLVHNEIDVDSDEEDVVVDIAQHLVDAGVPYLAVKSGNVGTVLGAALNSMGIGLKTGYWTQARTEELLAVLLSTGVLGQDCKGAELLALLKGGLTPELARSLKAAGIETSVKWKALDNMFESFSPSEDLSDEESSEEEFSAAESDEWEDVEEALPGPVGPLASKIVLSQRPPRPPTWGKIFTFPTLTGRSLRQPTSSKTLTTPKQSVPAREDIAAQQKQPWSHLKKGIAICRGMKKMSTPKIFPEVTSKGLMQLTVKKLSTVKKLPKSWETEPREPAKKPSVKGRDSLTVTKTKLMPRLEPPKPPQKPLQKISVQGQAMTVSPPPPRQRPYSVSRQDAEQAEQAAGEKWEEVRPPSRRASVMRGELPAVSGFGFTPSPKPLREGVDAPESTRSDAGQRKAKKKTSFMELLLMPGRILSPSPRSLPDSAEADSESTREAKPKTSAKKQPQRRKPDKRKPKALPGPSPSREEKSPSAPRYPPSKRSASRSRGMQALAPPSGWTVQYEEEEQEMEELPSMKKSFTYDVDLEVSSPRSDFEEPYLYPPTEVEKKAAADTERSQALIDRLREKKMLVEKQVKIIQQPPDIIRLFPSVHEFRPRDAKHLKMHYRTDARIAIQTMKDARLDRNYFLGFDQQFHVKRTRSSLKRLLQSQRLEPPGGSVVSNLSKDLLPTQYAVDEEAARDRWYDGPFPDLPLAQTSGTDDEELTRQRKDTMGEGGREKSVTEEEEEPGVFLTSMREDSLIFGAASVSSLFRAASVHSSRSSKKSLTPYRARSKVKKFSTEVQQWRAGRQHGLRHNVLDKIVERFLSAQPAQAPPDPAKPFVAAFPAYFNPFGKAHFICVFV
jgi:hypothetical protein